jgi:hypothetical protein
VLPLLWGLLFVVGGITVWLSIPRPDEDLPGAWKQTAGAEVAPTELVSSVRPGGARQGSLLRLEWPAHPTATGYRLRFRTPDGTARPPVTVQGTVFLYDLHSNALRLPSEFEWQVSAELADGSEILTPAQRFPPVP